MFELALDRDRIEAFAHTVDAADRLKNVEQIRALAALGYEGAYSYEPFAASVYADPTIETSLRESMEFLVKALEQPG